MATMAQSPLALTSDSESRVDFRLTAVLPAETLREFRYREVSAFDTHLKDAHHDFV